MPRGFFEFLLPDALSSLSTLGAAIPAGRVAGTELASQMDARNVEQQLRALQMMNEQRKLNATMWHFQPGLGIPVSPSGQLGEPVTLPVPPKQFAPLKPIERAEEAALKGMTDTEQAAIGKKLLEGQQKNAHPFQARADAYIEKNIPFERWHPQVKEWWAKQMTSAPHPVAMVLNKAVKDGKASLNPAEREIFNRAMRGAAERPERINAIERVRRKVMEKGEASLTPGEKALWNLDKSKMGIFGILQGGGLPGVSQGGGQPKTAEGLFKMMDAEEEQDTSSSE